jgi:DNA (cytosine-5)-methyltransferase 1
VRVGELFAGIGGMGLGLERAGFTVAWQVEVDPACRRVLERHWPDVPRRGDVRLAGADSLAPVDCIAGGFPCQDISTAGKGAGIDGGRSGLWREFARILGELRPRWVLIENVPALRRRGADRVLGDLEALGYACWPLVVGARHVGAPHRRDRVWIVGRLADATDAGPRGTFSHERGAGSGARGASRGGGPYLADADHERCEERRAGLAASAEHAAAQCAGDVADADGAPLRHEPGGRGGARGAGAAEPRDADALAESLRGRREGRAVPTGSGDAGERARGAVAAGSRHAWPARPGEPQHDWEAPRCLESGMGGAAPRFSRRVDSVKRRARLKMLGNAVVPQVAEAIGRAMLALETA